MAVKFEDNTIKVTEALSAALTAYMNEAGGELVRQTRRNSRVDTGQTKGSYTYRVTDTGDGVELVVGSSLDNAIWEELGTGEFALGGNGRKGGWVYKSEKDGKFYRTSGKKPQRPLFKAFTLRQNAIKKGISNSLKQL